MALKTVKFSLDIDVAEVHVNDFKGFVDSLIVRMVDLFESHGDDVVCCAWEVTDFEEDEDAGKESDN